MNFGKLATCIGCGCTDVNACVPRHDGSGPRYLAQPCSWLVVDRKAGAGVCSCCPGAKKRWERGDREQRMDRR